MVRDIKVKVERLTMSDALEHFAGGIAIPKGYEEILTKDEVRALTGRAHRADQVNWLMQNHWVFALNAANDPIIGRWYLRAKLAGEGAPNVSSGRVPDFSKVS
jgi:hypothetical protein